jgi:hypothetical protein
MRLYVTYLFLLVLLPASAQSKLDWLLNDMPQNTPSFRPNIRFHSSIYPRIVANTLPSDSNMILEIIVAKSNQKISVVPIADFGFRGSNTPQYRAMAGASAEGTFGRKLYARFSYLQGIEKATDFFQSKSTLSFPIDSSLNQKIDLRGRVSYSPNQFINLQGGWDNQYIGEGNRSLFLSDYGKPMGFGLARLNFWRIEYLMLYQFMQEKNALNERINKYASTHYISLNAAKWLQIGIFESVVFQPKDTLLNRGFEAEYINPMIFYRPQEYALGSSDNVLLGIDAKVKIRRLTFYGQLMMDEFNLADIKGRTKWWANKYAVQMGLKTYRQIQNNEFFFRGEMNIVRPYTYSHLSVAQSYTNQNLPLAHPSGANFAEILFETKWQKKKWSGELFVSYWLKGYNDTLNYGGDVTVPYINRPLDDYGHTIGQGIGNNAFHAYLRVAYDVISKYKLQAFTEVHYRYNTYLNEPQGQFLLGIRSRLWNDYRNY